MKTVIKILLLFFLIFLFSCQSAEEKLTEKSTAETVRESLIYEPGGMWMPSPEPRSHHQAHLPPCRIWRRSTNE